MRLLILLAYVSIAFAGCSNTKRTLGQSVATATKFFGNFRNVGLIENDSYYVLNSVLGQIVTIDEFGNIVPDLAIRWAVSEDKKKYSFELRLDATYSNGESFKPQDALEAIGQFIKSDDSYAKYLKPALKVARIDPPNILKIEFDRPVLRFLHYMATRLSLTVIHPKMRKSDGSLDLTQPTLGVYKIKEISGQKVQLTVRPEHPRYRPDLPSEINIFNSSKSEAIAKLNRNEIDFLFLGGHIDPLIESGPYDIVRSNAFLVTYLHSKLEKTCGQKAPVWISRKLDRHRIVRDATTTASRQLLPRNAVGSLSETELDEIFSREIGSPQQKCIITICALRGSSVLKSIELSEIAHQLQSTNTPTQIKELDAKSFSNELDANTNECGLILTSTILEDSLSEIMLGAVFASYVHRMPREISEMDRLLEQIHYASSLETMAGLIRKFSYHIVERGYLIPISNRSIYWAIHPRINMNLEYSFFHTIHVRPQNN